MTHPVNIFFGAICFIPHYSAYILGAIIKAVIIGFKQGWERICEKPEDEYDPKRYML